MPRFNSQVMEQEPGQGPRWGNKQPPTGSSFQALWSSGIHRISTHLMSKAKARENKSLCWSGQFQQQAKWQRHSWHYKTGSGAEIRTPGNCAGIVLGTAARRPSSPVSRRRRPRRLSVCRSWHILLSTPRACVQPCREIPLADGGKEK